MYRGVLIIRQVSLPPCVRVSHYGMLADNVSSPFNEYLNLLIHFGVVGFMVVLFLLGIVIIDYKKQPTEGKKIALLSLSGIGVF